MLHMVVSRYHHLTIRTMAVDEHDLGQFVGHCVNLMDNSDRKQIGTNLFHFLFECSPTLLCSLFGPNLCLLS